MTKTGAIPRSSGAAVGWIEIAPFVSADSAARRALQRCAERLKHADGDESEGDSVPKIRAEETLLAQKHDITIGGELAFCVNVLCDLRAQGWQFRTNRTGDGAIAVAPPVRAA